jgi:hypothetical protein
MIILPISVSDFYRFETPFASVPHLSRMLTTNHFLGRARSATIRRSICIAAQQSVATAVKGATTPRLTKTDSHQFAHIAPFGPPKKLPSRLKSRQCRCTIAFSYVPMADMSMRLSCCHTAERTSPEATKPSRVLQNYCPRTTPTYRLCCHDCPMRHNHKFNARVWWKASPVYRSRKFLAKGRPRAASAPTCSPH